MRLQDIPMQRKLVGSFLLVGCVPAVLLTLVSVLVAIFSLSSSTYEQLTGLRQAKQQQLDNYLSGDQIRKKTTFGDTTVNGKKHRKKN